MTREEFQGLVKERIVYLDGATGSNLVKAGMPSGVCPEQWILEHKETFVSLQSAYVEAGTDIIYAPTFTANRVKLREYHMESHMESMIHELVALSRKAAETVPDRKVYVAGDLTMTGEQLKPIGTMDMEQLIDIYKEEIACLVSAGVDLLVIETMMSLAETRAALIAAKESCDLPVMVTMTFEESGRTLFGTDAETAAIVAESLGACAVGVNCSAGPDSMVNIIEAMVKVTNIPVIAKPNAGLPCLDSSGNTSYSMGAEKFAEEMKALVEAGAVIIGGCCGTSPEYIRAIYKQFGYRKCVVNRRQDEMCYLTSQRKTVSFEAQNRFMLIGEPINLAANEELQDELREGEWESVLDFVGEQEENDACLLGVNLVMSGIDEKEIMIQAIEEIGMATNMPLLISSGHAEVLDAALRNYHGRALVNLVALGNDDTESMLPVVEKYGALLDTTVMVDQNTAIFALSI